MSHQIYRGVGFDAVVKPAARQRVDGLVYRGARQNGDVRPTQTVEPKRAVAARRVYRGVTWTPERSAS